MQKNKIIAGLITCLAIIVAATVGSIFLKDVQGEPVSTNIGKETAFSKTESSSSETATQIAVSENKTIKEPKKVTLGVGSKEEVAFEISNLVLVPEGMSESETASEGKAEKDTAPEKENVSENVSETVSETENVSETVSETENVSETVHETEQKNPVERWVIQKIQQYKLVDLKPSYGLYHVAKKVSLKGIEIGEAATLAKKAGLTLLVAKIVNEPYEPTEGILVVTNNMNKFWTTSQNAEYNIGDLAMLNPASDEVKIGTELTMYRITAAYKFYPNDGSNYGEVINSEGASFNHLFPIGKGEAVSYELHTLYQREISRREMDPLDLIVFPNTGNA